MAKSSITLTAQSTPAVLAPVRKSRDYWVWFATLTAQGTFGGSTLTFYISFDKGVTLIALKDITDTAVTMTSNAAINIQSGTSRDISDEPQIWCELASGSGATVVVSVFDNN